MRLLAYLSCFLLTGLMFGQEQSADPDFSHYVTPEFLVGKTQPANIDFPETSLQTTYLLSFGKHNDDNPQEWAQRLGYPRTGVMFGVTDFGNSEKIGQAMVLQPYVEFDIGRKKRRDVSLNIGLGASYFNTNHDSLYNITNQAVSTRFTWNYRMFVNYRFGAKKKVNFRLSGGYFHHSNGHTKLPNQGLNSFLIGLSAQFNYKVRDTAALKIPKRRPKFNRTTNNFLDVRTGIGQMALSNYFNDRKEVYSVAVSYGKVVNRTYKFGVGFYYRFYEQYYDYIKGEKQFINEEFPEFKDNPFRYASTYGVFGSFEVLLNHFGLEVNIGANFAKPFYEIDWRISQGFSHTFENNEGVTVIGVEDTPLSTKYEIKKIVSSRLGVKYYLWGTNNNPVHNVYVGIHLNANLGQADFSELSLGYVYNFNFKNKGPR